MIEGSLDNVPLTDVLQIVTTGQKSGLLTLERREAIARVHVDRGKIQIAHMEPGTHLGELLVRMDFLSAREVQLLLDEMREAGETRPLGALAVDHGLLSSDDLRHTLRHQAIEVLAELLSWSEGRFSFTEQSLEQGIVSPDGGYDAMHLLMAADGVRRDLDEGSADPSTVYERAGDPTQYDLPDGSWDLLGVLDGRLTARTVVAETDMTEIDGLRVLHQMEELGVIHASARDGTEPTVLVLSAHPTMQRLLRLALQRADMQVELFDDDEEAFAGIDRVRPRVIVIDGRSTAAWPFVRRLRDASGRGHLPVLVLEDDDERAGLFGRWRRRKADTMAFPFDELELQRTVSRMAGHRLL